MPGWHSQTKSLEASGKIRVAGLIQEQHPQRCRLFMQWKQMDWPVMVDSLNRLGVSAVPITLAIDEHGIIRQVRPSFEAFKRDFLGHDFEKPENRQPAKQARPPSLEQQRQEAESAQSATAWRELGQALVLWGAEQDLSDAIKAYRQALELEPSHGPTHFQLGAAYRRRYESDHRQPDDFQHAIEQWGKALDINPNQYIWRRRIQQYGPQLDKPYPFYDWVRQAKEAIRARGETPIELQAKLTQSELAAPAESIGQALSGEGEPDPQGRIYRDKQGLVRTEATVVPRKVAPGSSAQVHIAFRPNEALKAHWNNEMEDLKLWVDAPEDWRIQRRLWEVENPPEAITREIRRIELELGVPESAGPGPTTIPAYALYYVCEDVNGACLYRRQDISIKVEIARE